MDTIQIKDDEINVEEIMRKIRDNIRERRESGAYTKEMEDLINEPMQTPIASAGQDDTPQNLNYIKSNWDVHAEYSINSHRPLLGRFLVWGRKLVHGEVRRYVDLITGKQSEFNAHVTRILNSSIKGFDKKINDTVIAVNNDIDAKVNGAVAAVNRDIDVKVNETVAAVNRDIDVKVNGAVAAINRDIDAKVNEAISAINKDIENKAWLADILEKRIKTKNYLVDEKDKLCNNAINYFIFNELFGGSIGEIRTIEEQFLEFFLGCKNVLDIGSGRGVFLELLREKRIKGYGIDINDDLILYCKKKDLEVQKDDAISHLEKLNDKSLDGVFMAHVIEHLKHEEIVCLLRLCYEKMQYGSYIAIAMPNILNITVSSNTFYLDPTHTTHLHPEVIKFLLKSCGFRDIQERFYQPIPNELKLKRFDCDANLNTEQKNIYETINYNIDILNNLLFGYRDFAVIAKK